MRLIGSNEEELLNRVTAIRAAAEILEDNRELPAGDRQAFVSLICTETSRLQVLIRGMTR